MENILKSIRSWVSLAFFLTLCASPFPAHADVTLTFYSHDLDSEFPHAFIQAKGKLKSSQIIEESFGFTAKHISPSILLGSVKGVFKTPSSTYIVKSDPQFSIIIPDDTYDKIVTHRGLWLAKSKRSYNLKKSNCVHYVSEVLLIAGLKINNDSSYFKKPKSFLREVLALNQSLVSLNPEQD